MTTNVGTLDRAIRVLIGIALIVFLATGKGPAHWLGLIGVVPLATAAMGWCPLYRLLGFNSCPAPRR